MAGGYAKIVTINKYPKPLRYKDSFLIEHIVNKASNQEQKSLFKK